MYLRPPRSTRTDTLFPYATLFRSVAPYSSGKWVASDSTEASFSFRTLAYANTTYRVVYTSGSTDSWTFPATSNWRAIKARRDSGAKIVKSSSGRLYMQGNVDPGWANKSVKIRSEERRVGKECVSKGRSR